jgi:hypothetical protein
VRGTHLHKLKYLAKLSKAIQQKDMFKAERVLPSRFARIFKSFLCSIGFAFIGFFLATIVSLASGKTCPIGAGAAGFFIGIPLGSVIGLIFYRLISYGYTKINLLAILLGICLATINYLVSIYLIKKFDYFLREREDILGVTLICSVFIIPPLSALFGHLIVDYLRRKREL